MRSKEAPPLGRRSRARAAFGLLFTSFLATSCAKQSIPFPGSESFELSCPTVTPHKANANGFVIVGHRGAAGKAVENTIESMDVALRDGATALEIDVSMTSDGHVVLWHDWDPDTVIALARQAGLEGGVLHRPRVPDVGTEFRKPIDELTLQDLRSHYGYAKRHGGDPVRAHIPTFEEFVEWARTQKTLGQVFIDIKAPTKRAARAAEMITKMEQELERTSAPFNTVYMTPYPKVWDAIRPHIKGGRLSLDVDPGVIVVNDQDCDDASSRHALKAGSRYATTVNPGGWGREDWKSLKSLVRCDLEARDSTVRGPDVYAATIDQPDKMECLYDMGVNGLVTDEPALLKQTVTRKQLASVSARR